MEKINEVEIISRLDKQFGNDQDLGKNYRSVILMNFGKFDENCKKYPNDFDLGKNLRKKIKN
jgi:hypothetical protein